MCRKDDKKGLLNVCRKDDKMSHFQKRTLGNFSHKSRKGVNKKSFAMSQQKK